MRALCLMFAIMALSACVSHNQAPAQQAAAVVAAAPPPSVQAMDYPIGAGDSVTITFTYTPERTQTQIVRPDGKISLPVINDVDAAGLTTDQLRQSLIRRYTQDGDLRDPDITVTIQAYAANRVYVAGEVVTPGAQTIVGPTTPLQAVMLAGGFKDTARKTQVIVVRQKPDGGVLWREISLEATLSGKSAVGNVPLQPHDIVFVPKSRIANVGLFVDQYIRQLLPISPSIQIPAQ